MHNYSRINVIKSAAVNVNQLFRRNFTYVQKKGHQIKNDIITPLCLLKLYIYIFMICQIGINAVSWKRQ